MFIKICFLNYGGKCKENDLDWNLYFVKEKIYSKVKYLINKNNEDWCLV